MVKSETDKEATGTYVYSRKAVDQVNLGVFDAMINDDIPMYEKKMKDSGDNMWIKTEDNFTVEECEKKVQSYTKPLTIYQKECTKKGF